MLIYAGIKSEFLDDVDDDLIATKLCDAIQERLGRRTPDNEYRSWNNSMQFMYKVMSRSGIPDNAGVAIEYNIPTTSKRIDFIVSGYDNEGKGNAEIIELKQWETAELVPEKENIVRTFLGRGVREVVHPSYQACTYVDLLRSFNVNVEKEHIKLRSCAYLHNYRLRENDPLKDKHYKDILSITPVFTQGDVGKLRSYLKENITKGDNGEVLRSIESSELRPSKKLQDALANMIKGNPEFVMIDDQETTFQEILYQARKCRKDGKKRTIIVEGGPGTGKSVVAINLLVGIINQLEGRACYVTPNQAPRSVYSQKLKGSEKRANIDLLFKGSGGFSDVAPNGFDAVIVDEAHRLKSRTQYSKTGVNQVMEVIRSTRLSVFFIDDNQRVTWKDIGTTGEIEKYARELDSELTHLKLESQFRCNGSDGYLSWVDDVLEIRQTANPSLDGIDYDFRVYDTPEAVEKEIIAANDKGEPSRIVAGYCWEWQKSGRYDAQSHDIVIGDWSMSWNLDGGTTKPYAIDPQSVEQAGCIHTVQGLEFVYAGVIIGDDLRYENGKLICDPTKRAKSDRSLDGWKKCSKENPELALERTTELIKNTYRTLLTRGSKGCFVYCSNEGLRDYLRARLTLESSVLEATKDIMRK